MTRAELADVRFNPLALEQDTASDRRRKAPAYAGTTVEGSSDIPRKFGKTDVLRQINTVHASLEPMKTVNPDIDWQAGMLAGKVLKRAMSLETAARELDDWQREAEPGGSYRAVDSRSLIVTHALNTLLKRGY